jgi:hypothetical protein
VNLAVVFCCRCQLIAVFVVSVPGSGGAYQRVYPITTGNTTGNNFGTSTPILKVATSAWLLFSVEIVTKLYYRKDHIAATAQETGGTS